MLGQEIQPGLRLMRIPLTFSLEDGGRILEIINKTAKETLK